MRSLIIGNNSKRDYYFGPISAPYICSFGFLGLHTSEGTFAAIVLYSKSDILVKTLLIPGIAAGLESASSLHISSQLLT